MLRWRFALGLARGIDCLITLNKPQMDSEIYRPGENIGRFYNISTVGWDWLQFWGSAAKRHYKTDPRAVNKVFDTFRSKLKPHAALVWDDEVREIWWRWSWSSTVARRHVTLGHSSLLQKYDKVSSAERLARRFYGSD